MTLAHTSQLGQTLRNRMAFGLLWAALALMIGGVTLPAISVSSFWVFGETYSILGGILAMAERGDVVLAGFVFAVSVLFPMAKIVLGLIALHRMKQPDAKLARIMGRLSALSRWSMADVLVLALLVIILNGQVLTTADVHSGVALFAMGVAASALGLAIVERRANSTSHS
ncbi:paraquat-inducible protein A [Pyruvatibacter sp.]